MVAGLFALVLLRFCYDLSAPVAQDGAAKIGVGMNIEQRLCEQTNFELPTSAEKLTQEELAFEAEIDLT
jgi:hypothetical protein